MRLKKTAAGFLAVAATSLALASAVPAQADPTDDQQAQQMDQAFLKALKDKALHYKTDADAIDLAHSTCEVLVRTGSVDSALRHIKNATDWTVLKDITNFGTLSVQAYCPTAVPKSG